MSKEAEIRFLERAGPGSAWWAANKPYCDPERGRYLIDLGLILSLLPQPPARVLDLGCGSGWTSLALARSGYAVVGQDIAPDMIALADEAQCSAGVDNLSFHVGDYEDLPFEGEFDAALFYDALHHASCEKVALRAVQRALRPGGICVVVEPGIGHADSTESREAHRLYGVTERDMPPRLVIRAARAAGFRSWAIYPHLRQVRNVLFPGGGNRFRRLVRCNFIFRALALAFLDGPHKLANGIVVLTK